MAKDMKSKSGKSNWHQIRTAPAGNAADGNMVEAAKQAEGMAAEPPKAMAAVAAEGAPRWSGCQRDRQHCGQRDGRSSPEDRRRNRKEARREIDEIEGGTPIALSSGRSSSPFPRPRRVVLNFVGRRVRPTK